MRVFTSQNFVIIFITIAILYLLIMAIQVFNSPKYNRRRRTSSSSVASDDYESVSQSYYTYYTEEQSSQYTNSRYCMTSDRNSLFDQRLDQNTSINY